MVWYDIRGLYERTRQHLSNQENDEAENCLKILQQYHLCERDFLWKVKEAAAEAGKSKNWKESVDNHGSMLREIGLKFVKLKLNNPEENKWNMYMQHCFCTN